MNGWFARGLVALAIVIACASPVRGDDRGVADALLQRWAPVYVQHVDDKDRGADRPTRVDFDGNWVTTDNWERQRGFGTRLPPVVYGAAVLTASHAYLTYTLYYPRDWHRGFCVSLLCHDNDLENVQLVVDRTANQLIELRIKAHLATSDTEASGIARAPDGRPLLWVESQGHGVSACRAGARACTASAGRIVYAPGAGSSPPTAATGQTVTYQLLSLYDTLWSRRHFPATSLWERGETGPLFYRGLRVGRVGYAMGASMAGSRYLGGVRPPWAVKGAIGTRGDWFLDPAGATYTYNPYLDDLAAECRGHTCAQQGPKKEQPRWKYLVKLAAPSVLTTAGVIGLASWLRHDAAAPQFSTRTPWP